MTKILDMVFLPPIGISDFVKLREQGAYYVDKTGFIGHVLKQPKDVSLFPRPRRFGKTLNLSTLRTFVEMSETDHSKLFEGLEVWNDPEARKHFQRYPVIYLTFKDVKASQWEDAFAGIRDVIAREVGRHAYLLKSDVLNEWEKATLERRLRQENDASLFWNVLADLSRHLHAYHGERAIILIDEYDIPIQAAYTHGYFDQAVEFFRNFLSAGLKDNGHLMRGVLTGVLRVAKESIFSGLNNVDVFSILGDDFATSFGFTQQEVDRLASDMGDPHAADEMRAWYDGYRFAGQAIYNPWSVLMYASKRSQGCRPYWVFTGSEDVLRELILKRGHRMDEELEVLLRGDAVAKVVDEHVVLRDLEMSTDAVWNLLLLSGYLTTREVELVRGRLHAKLAIPNEEVRIVFEDTVSRWLRWNVGGDDHARALLKAMLEGDERTFAKTLSMLVTNTLSYHDTGGRMPERVYQAFLLGLLVELEGSHQVRSNRESGFGRYDVAVIPKQVGKPGVVLELKRIEDEDGETRDEALDAALEQLASRAYRTEVEAAGADPIHEYGVVFDGKRVWVKKGPLPRK